MKKAEARRVLEVKKKQEQGMGEGKKATAASEEADVGPSKKGAQGVKQKRGLTENGAEGSGLRHGNDPAEEGERDPGTMFPFQLPC